MSGLKYQARRLGFLAVRSHPAWGEWIEIARAPCGFWLYKSHPAWGEWIEMPAGNRDGVHNLSHPAWGEWIEICGAADLLYLLDGLTPHGVSGLKFPFYFPISA